MQNPAPLVDSGAGSPSAIRFGVPFAVNSDLVR
jgi:hypothetical protein